MFSFPKITKADGTEEPFQQKKLRDSLRRSGTSPENIEKIVAFVERNLKTGESTEKIYKNAYSMLKKVAPPENAARYSLRRALFDFGPSGFPFEDFVKEIFRAKGYIARSGVYMKGHCVTHEIDVLAEKEKERIGCELKFHNKVGLDTDLKVALYVHARFLDIDQHSISNSEQLPFTGKYLITNTKFTSSTIEYAKCVGLSLIGWSYPRVGNLQDLIEETGLHPITCLTTIPKKIKNKLLDEKIVLCRSIKQNPMMLQKYGLKQYQIDAVFDETNRLCVPGAGV